MINLLPDTGRDSIRREYRSRLVATVLWGVALTSALTAVALLPSYFLSQAKREAVAVELAVAEGARGSVGEGVAAELTAARDAAAALEDIASQTPPSDLVFAALARKPRGVSVTLLQYERTASRETLRIQGEAADRESLIAFRRELSLLQGAGTVDLPVSNLAKSTDIPYVLTVVVENKP